MNQNGFNYSIVILEARRQASKSLRENSFQPKICYPAKLSIEYKHLKKRIFRHKKSQTIYLPCALSPEVTRR